MCTTLDDEVLALALMPTTTMLGSVLSVKKCDVSELWQLHTLPQGVPCLPLVLGSGQLLANHGLNEIPLGSLAKIQAF